MEQIIAFGDSNTWGLNPVLKNRYPEHARWTGILRNRLSRHGFLLTEEGLCGRTTVFEDPGRTGMKGLEDVPRILVRNPRASAAIIMLGTNDCKKAFHASAEEIGVVLGKDVWRPEKDPEFDQRSVLVSAGLEAVYAKLARKRGHLFLAASDYVSPCGFDDEHLNAEGHEVLADAVCQVLTESLMRSA